MYKLNLTLMVVLALGVIGAVGALSLRRSSIEEDSAHARKLLRKLADADPDVRKEAESELRDLGPRAVKILESAVASSDPLLAGRAAKVLRSMDPSRGVQNVAVASPEGETEPAVAPKAQEPVEIALECGEYRVAAGDVLRFYVRLRNNTPQRVLVARERILRYAKFARFEVADEKGEVRALPSEGILPVSLEGETEFVPVEPGRTLDLYAGPQDGRTGVTCAFVKGMYKIKFVYDASPGSAYREVLKGILEGTPLPPVRLISNAVDLQVE